MRLTHVGPWSHREPRKDLWDLLFWMLGHLPRWMKP